MVAFDWWEVYSRLGNVYGQSPIWIIKLYIVSEYIGPGYLWPPRNSIHTGCSSHPVRTSNFFFSRPCHCQVLGGTDALV